MKAGFAPRRRFCAMVLALVSTALLLFGCGGEREALSSYSFKSPIVDPGEELSAEDFLFVSEFADSTYTAEFEEEPDTITPGVHSATLIVTDSEGNETSERVTYTVRSYIYETVSVELGAEITPKTFVNTSIAPDGISYSFTEETDTSQFTSLGTYSVGLMADDTLYECTLTVEDTTAPTATAVTVYITSKGVTPSASSFVTNIVDATNVTCTFAEDYDFTSSTDDMYVRILLTDEAGNTTEITSFLAYSIKEDDE